MKKMWMLTAAAMLAGCGGDAPAGRGVEVASPPEPATAAAVEQTGNVIEVRMVTDDRGNYFEPSEITARRGDVLRFTLVSGVHNVSFPVDQASGTAGLPGAGPFLQLPGQTHEVTVDMEPGSYGLQCDPHAALGMVGALEVVEARRDP